MAKGLFGSNVNMRKVFFILYADNIVKLADPRRRTADKFRRKQVDYNQF